MKTTIFAVAMLLGLTLNAQTTEKKNTDKPAHSTERKVTTKTPEQRADARVHRYTKELALNEKQQKEIKQALLTVENGKQVIFDENKEKRKAGVKLTEEEKNTRKIKVLEQKIALDKELKKILTAEQFAKYEQLRTEKKADIATTGPLNTKPKQN